MAQVNHVVGDLAGNAAMVLERTRAAAAHDADLVVFPEMTLTGYPPEDLVLRSGFRAAARDTLEKLAGDLAGAGLGETAVLVGYLDDDGHPRNALAFLFRGRVVARYFKHHLPNYGVFDERRYFVPGRQFVLVRHLGVDLALTICEDLWQPRGPFAAAGAVGVGLVLNVNGSPYERNKDDVRLALLQRRAAEARAPIVYVNTVGGQDELVFDGDSMVVDVDGTVLTRAPQYVEDVYFVDLDVPAATGPLERAVDFSPFDLDELITAETGVTEPRPHPEPCRPPQFEPLPDEAEVWGALVTGLRDYIRKNGFGSVVLGVSGGIDSAVVAAIAADAIGGENVHGLAMPSAYSTEHSRSDARELMERIGGPYRETSIAPIVDAYVSEFALTGVAEENVQARIRGTMIMAVSNADGHLVLATGNKSELAVGYATIYDAGSIGGFSPLKDVPKTLVWKIARWRNAEAERRGERAPIPENSITKPPSAELRPGQLDSDSLPDYELLDAILARYVDRDEDVDEIVDAGFDAATVTRIARLVDAAEWKRRQFPPGSKITYKAFGRDRRLPITNRWRETRR